VAAIVKWLRSVRYAVGDVLFVIGKFLGKAFSTAGRVLLAVPVALGRGATRFWRSLSVIARRRLVAAVAAAAVLVVFFSAIVPNLPCQFPGGDGCPPAEDALELVPADSLAYVHANIDPETEEFAAASQIGDDLPVLSGQLAQRALALAALGGGEGLDFEGEIAPWFAGELALIVLPGDTTTAERVQLLEVADEEGATEYADAIAVGQVATAEYEGVEVSVDQRDTATAVMDGFLAIGTEAAVQAVIATSEGADSLADDSAATEVRDELPDHRFADAWLAPEGIDDLVAANPGALGTLSPLLAPGVTLGAALSLSADEGELEVAVRSALEPEREDSDTFFGAFPAFEPTLAERLRPGTLAYLGLGDPSEAVSSLISQAGAEAPGIAAGFAQLAETLRREANVDLEGGLIEALGDQAAFALEPAPGQGDAPLAAPPFGLFLAEGVDEDAARRGLAALAGQASVFEQTEIAGVETNSVRVSPTTELTYAVFDGLAAVSTDAAGVAQTIEGEGGLERSALYERATEDMPDEVAVQLFLDLGGLVRAGEEAGLAEDPVYAAFAGEFRRLDALALAVTDADDTLATDLRLLVGEGDAPDAPGGSLPTPGD
jgi:hypothetical protein